MIFLLGLLILVQGDIIHNGNMIESHPPIKGDSSIIHPGNKNLQSTTMCDALDVVNEITKLCDSPAGKVLNTMSMQKYGHKTNMSPLGTFSKICDASGVLVGFQSSLCESKITSNLFESSSSLHRVFRADSSPGCSLSLGCNIQSDCTRGLTQSFYNTCGKITYGNNFFTKSLCTVNNDANCFIDNNKETTIRMLVIFGQPKGDVRDMLDYRTNNPHNIGTFDNYYAAGYTGDLFQGGTTYNYLLSTYDVNSAFNYTMVWGSSNSQSSETKKDKFCYEVGMIPDCIRTHTNDIEAKCIMIKTEIGPWCVEDEHLIMMNGRWSIIRDVINNINHDGYHMRKLNSCIRSDFIEVYGGIKISTYVVPTPELLVNITSGVMGSMVRSYMEWKLR